MPFHHVSGVPNFRDIGGYPTSVGPNKVVRRGIVFRSADPSQVTDAGIKTLNELGITCVYDLRSKPEVSREGKVREWDGSTRIFAPVFMEEDYSPEALAVRWRMYAFEGTEGIVRAYKSILEAGCAPTHPATAPFRAILCHLATEPGSPPPSALSNGSSRAVQSQPSPLLIHCTAGKDRTGVISALILSLCGVSDADVAHDYSLTDVGLVDQREHYAASLLVHPAIAGDREAAERMMSAREENMLSTLAMIHEEYGSVERYVIEKCGLSSEAVERIRANLIVDDETGRKLTSKS